MRFDPEFFTYIIGTSTDPLIGGSLTYDETFDFVRFNNDADFECRKLVCFADDIGDPQTDSSRRIPNFNFNIRDNATGRTLFNGFVSTAELFGDGKVPFILPTSHFFTRATIAQMLYDPVTPGPDFLGPVVWLGMVGVKHFAHEGVQS